MHLIHTPTQLPSLLPMFPVRSSLPQVRHAECWMQQIQRSLPVMDSNCAHATEHCFHTILRFSDLLSVPLKVTQCLVADAQFHDGPSVSTAFFILPGSQSSPLWRETAETLQLLKIVNQVATPSPPVSNNKNLDNYSGLCERTAKLKNHPVKLHINKFVPPVARKHSQSHFISDTK